MFRLRETGFAAVLAIAALMAPSAIAGGAKITWTASASPGVTCHNIYYGTAKGGPYPGKVSVGVVTAASVPNLNNGATYYFVVTACNAAGESPYSNEASATIPFGQPGPVTGASAVGTP